MLQNPTKTFRFASFFRINGYPCNHLIVHGHETEFIGLQYAHALEGTVQTAACPQCGDVCMRTNRVWRPTFGTRPAITFDVLFRYLKHIGYKVRYVRNITDVGHLEHDADEGEDKIAKKAQLEQLEPMEIAQHYTNRYHKAMEALNVLPPSIEPHATVHIIEQEELVKQILANGYAYESNGSIYFDVAKYDKDHKYGILSGRNLTDIINNSRGLSGTDEKHNQADFALWKRAMPEHIMRWPSPWSDGFPGWHCECTAMGRKYLGDHFDIHGGGMDLVFPHRDLCKTLPHSLSFLILSTIGSPPVYIFDF